MPRRVAGGTAIITAATIIRSTTITATTITPGTTITTVTATGIANPGYSPALRARAHTSLLRTYAPPRVRLGSSPEDFAAAHIVRRIEPNDHRHRWRASGEKAKP